MLTLYHSRAGRAERLTDLVEASLPANVAWIDLLRIPAVRAALRWAG